MNWTAIRQCAIQAFKLGPDSAHDYEHWDRVEKYAIYLTAQNGGDSEVARIFALLHDCQRQSEGRDPEHGPRAAAMAEQLCGQLFQLSPERLRLLTLACRDHEAGYVSANPTIGACWDADRLDLDRVGITPDPALLSTAAGKRLALLRPFDRLRLVLKEI